MFDRLKSYLQDRKLKKKLNRVLELLYSDKKYEVENLISVLRPKEEIDTLEYYIIIEIAAKLEVPYTDEDLTKIYDEEVKAFECYVASKELRENILKLTKTKASLSMLHFNAYMDMLRRAYEYNNYSPGGMLLRKFVSKKRPLTNHEKAEIEYNSKEIKRLDELADSKQKELEDLITKNKSN